jgi:hypothetical protein
MLCSFVDVLRLMVTPSQQLLLNLIDESVFLRFLDLCVLPQRLEQDLNEGDTLLLHPQSIQGLQHLRH